MLEPKTNKNEDKMHSEEIRMNKNVRNNFTFQEAVKNDLASLMW